MVCWRRCRRSRRSGRPLLVGPSRKSFLQRGHRRAAAAGARLGTAAAVTAAVLLGAHIVRVHAVPEMVEVVRVADAIRAPALSAVMLNWLPDLPRLPAMTWWDLLDIVIVSVLIYEVLKLIRGTRAVQMAAGRRCSCCCSTSRAGGTSRRSTGSSATCSPYIVFAVIVLFQADIRRALAHFGRAPFFRYFLTQEGAEETIEEIVVAATQLSAQRIGAIIAIERQIGLRNYIEAGLPLDAMLTYDLLVSIFQPTSPLHDGAVIVQDDRVAAAACFLPLTVNPKLAQKLGSRHRAAIGLTEENDAVAIVVSEETGRISVALDGKIEGPFDADELEAPAEGAPEMMRYHRPFAHIGLKMVSVALGAAAVAHGVVAARIGRAGLRVPLELQNLPENLEMVEPPQESVDVRVRGTADALSRLVARRSRGDCRPERGPAGPASVPSYARAREGAVCRCGHAGHAVVRRDPVRAVGHADRAGAAVGRRESRPPASSSARSPPIRRRSKSSDPRACSDA